MTTETRDKNKGYGETGAKLIQAAIRSRETPSIGMYQDALIRDILLEIKHLYAQLSMFEQLLGKDVRRRPELYRSIDAARSMHSLALMRNKQCVLAYQRYRLGRLVQMLWHSGCGASTAASLPATTMDQLSTTEQSFLDGYRTLASDYRGCFLDIDLGASLMPPKDVFVEIRVIRDCGEIMTEMGPKRLMPGAQLYVRRCDVDNLILSRDVREIR